MNISAKPMYQTISEFIRSLGDAFARLADQIVGIIMRYAANGDRIPPERSSAFRAECDQVITDYFGGRDAFASDGITPRSGFARLLNQYLAQVSYVAVEGHSEVILKYAPPDVLQWLRSAAPQQVPTYDPAHFWVDPNGYRLSDRVWLTDAETRRKIDAILADAVRRGLHPLEIANLVVGFLNPGEAPRMTRKPYGFNVSFSAMRLARTELTRAYGAMTIAASQNNPWVDGIDWALSNRHPENDVCDRIATIGMRGERLRNPYPKGDVPRYPTHPMDLCNLQPHVSANSDDMVARLRAQMQDGGAPPYAPVAAYSFTETQIGSTLIASLLSIFRQRERIPVFVR